MPGFSTPAELAVLNLAAGRLPAGEAYLEVGTFKGRSLAGALMDAPDRIRRGGELPRVRHARRRVARRAGARRTRRADRRTLHDGDCFRVLARRGAVPEPVGVYFYDGAHTGLAHYLALGVVEPLLADEALVLVDDASWPMVAEGDPVATCDRHPGWTVLRDIRAAADHDERVGQRAARPRLPAPGGRGPADGAGTCAGAGRCRCGLRGPGTSLVWRTLHRFPGLVPLAKRLVPKGSRTVPADAVLGGAGPGSSGVATGGAGQLLRPPAAQVEQHHAGEQRTG